MNTYLGYEMESINKIVFVLVEMIIGVYVIIQSWRILGRGKQWINITERIGLWVLGKWQGEEIALKKKMEITDPKRMRKIGFQALFMGIVIIVIATITFFSI